MNSGNIPQTDSIEELARFWDTHDLTDFEDQLEEVVEPVFERRTVVKVHLKPEEVEAVKEIATSKGIDDASLIREWILKHIETS